MDNIKLKNAVLAGLFSVTCITAQASIDEQILAVGEASISIEVKDAYGNSLAKCSRSHSDVNKSTTFASCTNLSLCTVTVQECQTGFGFITITNTSGSTLNGLTINTSAAPSVTINSSTCGSSLPGNNGSCTVTYNTTDNSGNCVADGTAFVSASNAATVNFNITDLACV